MFHCLVPYALTVCAVSGLGFGVVAAITLFSNILRESGGPAVPGIDERQTSQYYVLTMGNPIWLNSLKNKKKKKTFLF